MGRTPRQELPEGGGGLDVAASIEQGVPQPAQRPGIAGTLHQHGGVAALRVAITGAAVVAVADGGSADGGALVGAMVGAVRSVGLCCALTGAAVGALVGAASGVVGALPQAASKVRSRTQRVMDLSFMRDRLHEETSRRL